MTVLELALRFVNIVCAAMVAGGQVLVLLAIVPVKRGWAPPLSLQMHQDLLIVRPDRYLKPSVGMMFASGIAILILKATRRRRPGYSPRSGCWAPWG